MPRNATPLPASDHELLNAREALFAALDRWADSHTGERQVREALARLKTLEHQPTH